MGTSPPAQKLSEIKTALNLPVSNTIRSDAKFTLTIQGPPELVTKLSDEITKIVISKRTA